MELKEIMKRAGIVGAGGAGFPSYAKLSEGADTLLINGAECEPLLYTDYYILKNELSRVLLGAGAVLEYLGIPRGLLCIKNHTATRLGLSEGDSLSEKIKVKVLPDVYPIGDEISLIYEATGRIVRPGNLPITKGVIVYNVETAYNVAKALEGERVIMKWLTVGGAVKEPKVLRVPLGTPVSELLLSLGIQIPEGYAVVDGGPSMGKIINPELFTVKKTTKGILILPEDIQAIKAKRINAKMATARAETACCQCTRCTDMCPRGLLGYPLMPHRMVRTAMGAAEVSPRMVLAATLCCGCGICETLACCQGISPKSVIANYKTLLAKNKMRYTASEDVEVAAEREYRKVPSDRWMSALGVLRFDKMPEYIGERVEFSRLTLPLSQHIGAPSVPTVKAGDAVLRGETVAEAAEGLSVDLASPIDGKVILADENKIIISR